MALTYHFEFRAPAAVTASTLEHLLGRVEREAQMLGYDPTVVVNGPFDTPERRQLARRVALPRRIEDERLKGATLADGLAWQFERDAGCCWIAPLHGVFLVVTNERGAETVLGLFRFPAEITDDCGRVLMTVPHGADWWSRNYVTSSDPRYRALVRQFAAAGYLASELDEFEAITPLGPQRRGL